MRQAALIVRAANRQSVLVRAVLTAHQLDVAIVEVSVPPAVDENVLTDLSLVVRAEDRALDKLVRRLERVIDIASVEVSSRTRGSAVDPLSGPSPQVDVA